MLGSIAIKDLPDHNRLRLQSRLLKVTDGSLESVTLNDGNRFPDGRICTVTRRCGFEFGNR
ncbi:hypothetical protein C2E31_01650 [Rhodopirellula baltica]|nr:hypothetical protein C2E31_01650 [Rhodopirellula baltica]